MRFLGDRAYTKTVEGGATELEDLKQLMTIGYNAILPIFAGPLITWVILATILDVFFRVGMRFFGFLSWLGVFGGYFLGAYLDDLIFVYAGRISADTFGLSAEDGVRAVYDLYPEYKKNILPKLILSGFNILTFILFYGGWKQHVRYNRHYKRATQDQLDQLKLLSVIDL